LNFLAGFRLLTAGVHGNQGGRNDDSENDQGKSDVMDQGRYSFWAAGAVSVKSSSTSGAALSMTQTPGLLPPK
jgi:hypothetical protein